MLVDQVEEEEDQHSVISAQAHLVMPAPPRIMVVSLVVGAVLVGVGVVGGPDLLVMALQQVQQVVGVVGEDLVEIGRMVVVVEAVVVGVGMELAREERQPQLVPKVVRLT